MLRKTVAITEAKVDRSKAANRNSTEIGRSYSSDGSGALGEEVAVLTCPMDWVKSLRFMGQEMA